MVRPDATARIRSCPEDFQVDEELGFAADGEGEHCLLHIRKRNRNTDQLARQLARCAGVRARDIGYCGLKDRNAVSTQWFSVWLPGKPNPDWSLLEDESLHIIEQARHSRKLQRGALQGNRFTILLRDVQGVQAEIEQRLNLLKAQGVPNYFGEQRFGRDGGNIAAAQAMFAGNKVKDRHVRGLYLSAARSFLFNELLAARVVAGSWNNILPGEAVMLAGSRSFFVCDDVNEDIEQRLADDDIHPSGPLWGRGALAALGEAGALEQTVLAAFPYFCQGLEKAGLKQERRALRLLVKDLHWTWLSTLPSIKQEAIREARQELRQVAPDLQLNFSLPSGAYATTILREVVSLVK